MQLLFSSLTIIPSLLLFNRTAVVNSLWSLYLLGAVTEDNKLSDVGRQMARLPLDPVYSKALIIASQFGCLKEMLICVAMLSVESIFYAPREKLEEVVLCASLLLPPPPHPPTSHPPKHVHRIVVNIFFL